MLLTSFNKHANKEEICLAQKQTGSKLPTFVNPNMKTVN